MEYTEIDKKYIYTISEICYKMVCLFFILSCLTVIIDFLHLRLFAKAIQILTIGFCVLYIIKTPNQLNKRRKKIRNISLSIIIFQLLLFIRSIIIFDIPIFLQVQNFLQLFFIYFWIYFAFSIPKDFLKKITAFIQKVFYFGALVSIVEFITPASIRESLLELIIGSIPSSYFSRDFSFFPLRLGSFYLTPLTLSYSLLFLLGLYINNKKKSLYTFIISILAQTKTAILGGIYLYVCKKNKYINIFSFFFLFALLLFTCIVFDGNFFYVAFDGTEYKSLANHLSGLVFGIHSSFENLLGSGIGKSGYLSYVEIHKNATEYSFYYNDNPLELGNESTLGIIGYQLGGISFILHLLLIYKLFFYQHKNLNYNICAFIIIIFSFHIFSESGLTVLITFTEAIIFAQFKDEKTIENSNS